jgi:hypothetical protein
LQVQRTAPVDGDRPALARSERPALELRDGEGRRSRRERSGPGRGRRSDVRTPHARGRFCRELEAVGTDVADVRARSEHEPLGEGGLSDRDGGVVPRAEEVGRRIRARRDSHRAGEHRRAVAELRASARHHRVLRDRRRDEVRLRLGRRVVALGFLFRAARERHRRPCRGDRERVEVPIAASHETSAYLLPGTTG